MSAGKILKLELNAKEILQSLLLEVEKKKTQTQKLWKPDTNTAWDNFLATTLQFYGIQDFRGVFKNLYICTDQLWLIMGH